VVIFITGKGNELKIACSHRVSLPDILSALKDVNYHLYNKFTYYSRDRL
jgi:hypothetical protein